MSRTDPTKPPLILAIDDDAAMVELMQMILERDGFEVTTASGGREGLEKIKKLLPDLILLDIMMPDMGGWDVYEAMLAAELTYKIPVIVVSAKPEPDPNKDVIYTVTRPAAYLRKPFPSATLTSEVRRVLGN